MRDWNDSCQARSGYEFIRPHVVACSLRSHFTVHISINSCIRAGIDAWRALGEVVVVILCAQDIIRPIRIDEEGIFVDVSL